MPDPLLKTTFLVDAYNDPVIIKINGRASYLNCASFSDFIDQMIQQGKLNFALDFTDCTGMDSTFLGILASTALRVHKHEMKGEVILCHLSVKNLKLIRNVGLHRVVEIDSEGFPMDFNKRGQDLISSSKDEGKDAKIILQAHESLVQIDDRNLARFQDVISFLKNQVGPS